MTFDTDYCTEVLINLLEIPSPSGYTDQAIFYLEEELAALGLSSRRTPKGALLWTLKGGGGQARAVASHVDTLGAMVKEIKPSGRLKLTAIGGYDWATVEGEDCLVHPFKGEAVSGTIVTTKQSVHVFGQEARDLKRSDVTLELRLDAKVKDADSVRALGIGVGDFVSWKSRVSVTDTGFIKARHLDNKAAVAVCLAVTKSMLEAAQAPATDVNFFVSNYEEVGHGAAAGIPADISELLCIDMAAIGEGQMGDEYSVTLCVKDSSGPYDEGMNRRLRELARQEGIDLKVDIYPFYGSDASAAWRAGGSYRAALVGPGVDASHAYERTHRDALNATGQLLLAYLRSNAQKS